MPVDLNKEMDLGAKAEELLRHDFFVEVTTHVRDRLINDLVDTAPDQDVQRNLLYMQIHALNLLKGHLKTIAESGRMARQQYDQLNKPKK